jgi:ABC-type lipoprotein export system ATPase subunit
MSESATILQLKDVTKTYPGPEGGKDVRVLDNISMEVLRGESVAVVGPSGSGKSTLLNLIGALDRPTSGTVLLNGQDIAEMGDAGLASLRNQTVGLIFQMHHLLPQCTLLENVLIPTLAGQNPAGDVRDRAKRLLDRVGLGDRLTHRPGELSGGECQRVAVVRALINDPALLLADEPTGQLDHNSADNLADLLHELNEDEGVTLLVVTHSLELAARMDRALELRDATLKKIDAAKAAGAR